MDIWYLDFCLVCVMPHIITVCAVLIKHAADYHQPLFLQVIIILILILYIFICLSV